MTSDVIGGSCYRIKNKVISLTSLVVLETADSVVCGLLCLVE